MDGGARPPNRSPRVSPVDRLGRRISPVVLDAAEEIGRRAIEHAEKLLIDPAVAAGLLEEAAATVSRALASKKNCTQANVEDLPSYLFRAFIRRVDRIKKKQLAQVNDLPVPTFASGNSTDPQAAVETKILLDELLTRCDDVTREMFYRRIHGFSWEEIGRSYGISAHAAASRFSQALRRISEKLGLKSDL
jgi:DNA-directed RNA polymerase specialized sigma24 family protein